MGTRYGRCGTSKRQSEGLKVFPNSGCRGSADEQSKTMDDGDETDAAQRVTKSGKWAEVLNTPLTKLRSNIDMDKGSTPCYTQSHK